MRRWIPVLVQGVLLAAASLAAYLSWTADETAPQLGKRIWDLDAQAVRELRLEQPEQQVTLELKQGARGDEVPWIRIVRKPAPAAGQATQDGQTPATQDVPGKSAGSGQAAGSGAAAESGAVAGSGQGAGAAPGSGAAAGSGQGAGAAPGSGDAGGSGQAAGSGAAPESGASTGSGAAPAPGAAKAETDKTAEPVEQLFRASKEAGELLRELARLTVKRELPRAEGEQRRSLGLDSPTGRLVLESKQGAPRELSLGGKVYGTGQRYAEDPADGKVYVLEGRGIEELEQAQTRLLERDLHAFDAQEVDRATLSAGGKHRTVLRRKTGRPGWSPPGSPDVTDEQAGSWLGKIGRLRAVSYARPANRGSDGEPVAEVRFFKENEELGYLLLYRSDQGKVRYLAETEHTAGWQVEVTQFLAQETVNDLEGVMSASEP